jgi:polyhydroxybutyrate depolymerase
LTQIVSLSDRRYLLHLPPHAAGPLPAVVFLHGAGGTEFRAVVVAGLGHHWPGGRGRLSERIGGRPSGRVNANELIWAFFRRHRL